MDLSLDMGVEHQLRVSPTLIAVNQILALSSFELQNAIKQEAEENPAIDIVERPTCTICGDMLRHGVCASCSRSGTINDGRASSGDGDFYRQVSQGAGAVARNSSFHHPAARNPAGRIGRKARFRHVVLT